MKINLNDRVTVTLHESGKKILLNHHAKAAAQSKHQTEDFVTAMFPDWRKGNLTTELWNVMFIFGPHVGMTGDAPPIAMDIEIEKQ